MKKKRENIDLKKITQIILRILSASDIHVVYFLLIN